MIVKSMDESDRRFSDAGGLLKTWMPWRSEPAHVSMDFWVPDESSRVCYECDSEFTLFNRRHHCRLCGRIFCAKCSSNWLPCEDRNRIRACNYCFNEHQVSKSLRSSPLQNSLNIHISEDAENEASSSMNETEDVDIEPVDFENNGLLWLPPEPENAEDEMEAVLFEEEDSDEWKSDGCDIDSNTNVSNVTSLQTDVTKSLDEHLAVKEEFPPTPSDHQSIIISSSSRCVWKGTLCERLDFFRIKYYGIFDKPLGRFLRDQVFDQNFACPSCEMPIEAHVLCYTHPQGTLTISVKKLPEIMLPCKREGEIWMWHRCLRCPRTYGFPPATRRVLMSDAAWGLSFGKFLELSFSNHEAASEVGSCGHSLSRDCLRFYGYGQRIASFRCESLDVYSVCLPPAKLDFTYENQEWIEKEISEVVRRAERLFSEVLNALRLLGERRRGIKVPNSRHLIANLEGLLQKEKSIFEKSLQNFLKKEENIGQPLIDILELNRLLRELVFQAYVWDWRLRNAAGIGAPKKCSVSEFAEADPSSTVRVFDKEDDREDSPSVSPTKSSGDVEDNESWLTMPFSVYYRSSNKNWSWPELKLDILSGYNPIYISSFQYPELHGGARLLLPTGVNDTVIPVYDDEPSSLISYALVSHDYCGQLSDLPEDTTDSTSSMHSINTKTLHVTVPFTDYGKVKYTVTCYYAKNFEALRRHFCPTEVDFVRSLSRCQKWGAQGGDSNVYFAKTLDDRFIIKQVTKTKLESFMKFAPAYFTYVSESMDEGMTCLAKILGIYQLSSKHLRGGRETKMDVVVMENLLFRRDITRLYDLKGSSSSRYNPDSSGSNKVLLDQNLIEAMPASPICVGSKAKRLLERAVWNDTAFLDSIDVMDYSVLVGVDEEKHELILGIIDFMRQYTWDKQLESWVKACGIFLSGRKNASPTIISPKEYKKRFRKAMATYFVMVPDER